ncbi:MAG TPA: hypothetical protein VIL37_18140 [Natronosporangium sp.]
MVDRALSEGIIAYVGVPGRLDDRPAEDRVVAAIGSARAAEVLPRITAIMHEMYATRELSGTPDLAELGRRAEVWLRAECPELSGEAVNAVANRFAFDWK